MGVFSSKFSPDKKNNWSDWPNSIFQRALLSEEGQGPGLRCESAVAGRGHEGFE